MAANFAALEQRLGAAIIGRLANATLAIPDQAVAVEGIYTRRPYSAGLGAAGMPARETTFTCSTAHLTQPVAKGVVAAVTYGLAAPVNVRVFAREDHFETGQTTLVLEAAP